MKSNDQNDCNDYKFLQYLKSSGKFRNKIICKVNRYILEFGSNFLKNLQRNPFWPHLQKKLKKLPQKWQKLPNLCNIWNIMAYFGKIFSLKFVNKSIYWQKDNFISFSIVFVFYKNIVYFWTYYCIIRLGARGGSIYHSSANFWSFFDFLSPDIQLHLTFLTEIIATSFWFLENPIIKESSVATLV